MRVAGVAVAHEDAGELREYSAGVDVGGATAADVHQGQVVGARDVHVGQRAGGAAAGLIGVQHRRGAQQRSHMGQEHRIQQGGGPTPDAGDEPGRDLDPGHRRQQRTRAGDRQVMPACQQRRQRSRIRPEPHRRTRT